MSAMVNLAGLYPPDSIQQWNNNLGKLWQPIPIHSYPMANDKVIFKCTIKIYLIFYYSKYILFI